MRIAQIPAGSETAHASQANEDLRLALTQGLDVPLSALRASLEALMGQLGAQVSRKTVLGTLEEVERVGRNVRDLVELASPLRPLPLRCSVSEIIHGARRELDPELRNRVLVARAARESLEVDGPLLTRALRRVLENAFEAGSDHVLVVARQDASTTVLTVVDGAGASFDVDWALEPFHTTKTNHLGLGLALSRRELEALGGRLEVTSSAGRETRVCLTVPNAQDEPARPGAPAPPTREGKP